jgi:thiamine-monophosphate kinase
MRGVRRGGGTAGAAVLGGDITRSSGPLVLDVTVVGEAPEPVLRSGARPGTRCGSRASWAERRRAVAVAARRARPGRLRASASPPRRPGTREALWLPSARRPTAMIDLSDGLAGDAAHIAAASGAALVLDAPAIPIHPAAATHPDALRMAVSGGEDYELCFAARAGAVEPHAAAFEEAFGIALTRVGRVETGAGTWWQDGDGRRAMEGGGFQHFREDA